MPEQADRLRVGVLSDLHATTATGDDAGSWLTTTTVPDSRHHPLRALWPILATEKVDLLLCAGDITNQADPDALAWAWRELNELATHAGARLIATSGNHDLDSRHKRDLDPKGAMLDLEPPFPAGEESLRDSFWSRNYVIVEHFDMPSWRVVTLNSSAFHGYTEEARPRELDHGRVSSHTTRRLERDLDGRPDVDVQILLLHHHLVPLPALQPDGGSQVHEAQPLIDMLERTGPWIVIHGHQHQPHVMYAHGGGVGAVIFSAGSLAAHAFGQLSASAGKNQFYILEFAEEAERNQLDIGTAAQFRTWNWRPAIGWERAGSKDLLPGAGGFGWRISNPRSVAEKIAKRVQEMGGRLPLSDLLGTHPQFKYLTPSDLEKVLAQLDSRHRTGAIRDENGNLDTLAARLTAEDEDGDESEHQHA